MWFIDEGFSIWKVVWILMAAKIHIVADGNVLTLIYNLFTVDLFN